MRRITLALVVGLIVLAVVEGLSYAVFTVFEERFTWLAVDPWPVSAGKAKRLAERFDADLGWIRRFDTVYGERPREIDYGRPFMTTYGDSHTFGDDVTALETWQTYLSADLERDVYNLGVGAYGTDQAYLRFRKTFPELRTAVVSLGLISENIKRNMNVYRAFYSPRTGIPLTKPRLRLEHGELVTIANPITSASELERLRDPEFLHEIGRHDWWYNRFDQPRLRFPYTAILLDRRVWREALHGRGSGDDDPRPRHSLWSNREARELMLAILDAFVAEARRLEAVPIITFLAMKHDVWYVHRRGRLPESVTIVMSHCMEKGYLCFEAVSVLAEEVERRGNLKQLYEKGHVSAQGNRIIGLALADFMRRTPALADLLGE